LPHLSPYAAFQATSQTPSGRGTVIAEKLLSSPGSQQNPTASSSNPGANFEDQVGTRNMGNFNLTQQFYLSLPGIRAYRVQIVPCVGLNTFGSAVWQNIINATSQTVLINGDAGITTQGRTCGTQ
jgi:hypothetical protein